MAMVGDRVFTDVLFGNRNGMYTIWTREIISEKADNPVAAKVTPFSRSLIWQRTLALAKRSLPSLLLKYSLLYFCL